jgi:hypothetical protein
MIARKVEPTLTNRRLLAGCNQRDPKKGLLPYHFYPLNIYRCRNRNCHYFQCIFNKFVLQFHTCF